MSTSVPFETIENLKVLHSQSHETLTVFVEGFQVESAKLIDRVELKRDNQEFFLTVKSRLVTFFDHMQQEKMADQTRLRKAWGSDLHTLVSFAKEFTFEDLPEGSYQVRYDSARDSSKPVIYSFRVE